MKGFVLCKAKCANNRGASLFRVASQLLRGHAVRDVLDRCRSPLSMRCGRHRWHRGEVFRRTPWQDVCKFLAGAFFVSAGILFYLYLADVSVPLLGTDWTESPEVSGARSVVHAALFVTFFYLGFIRKWNRRVDQRNGDDGARLQ